MSSEQMEQIVDRILGNYWSVERAYHRGWKHGAICCSIIWTSWFVIWQVFFK